MNIFEIGHLNASTPNGQVGIGDIHFLAYFKQRRCILSDNWRKYSILNK